MNIIWTSPKFIRSFELGVPTMKKNQAFVNYFRLFFHMDRWERLTKSRH